MKILKVNNLKSLRSQALVTAKYESESDQYTVYLENLNLYTCSLEMNLANWDFMGVKEKEDVDDKVLDDRIT